MLEDMMTVYHALGLYDAMIEGADGKGDRTVALCRHDPALSRDLEQLRADYIDMVMLIDAMAAGLRRLLPKLGDLTLGEIGDRDRLLATAQSLSGLGAQIMEHVPEHERKIREQERPAVLRRTGEAGQDQP